METESIQYLVGLIYAILILFGFCYNALVGWMEHKHYDRGYTAFMVVGGVLAVIGSCSFLIGLENTLLIVGGFMAAGIPMILGSMRRYYTSREYDEITAARIAAEDPHNARS